MKEFNYYEYLRLKAAGNIITSDQEYIIRKIFRWYSKEYSTPLHLLENGTVSWDNVILHYFEHTLSENYSHNDLLDLLKNEMLPELAQKHEQELDEYAKSLEKEQEETLKKRQSIQNKAKNVKNLETQDDKEEPIEKNYDIEEP